VVLLGRLGALRAITGIARLFHVARKSKNHENTKERNHEKRVRISVSCFRSFVFS
jgi:hypothetical protein